MHIRISIIFCIVLSGVFVVYEVVSLGVESERRGEV